MNKEYNNIITTKNDRNASKEDDKSLSNERIVNDQKNKHLNKKKNQ